MYINVDSSQFRLTRVGTGYNQLQPVARPHTTAYNRFCVVRSGYRYFLNINEPVVVAVRFQKGKKTDRAGPLNATYTFPLNNISPCSSAHSSPLMVFFFFPFISFTAFTTSSSISSQSRILDNISFSEPSINK